MTIGDVLYSVNIHSLICDAPARSLVKGVECHSGDSASEKCVAHGEYCINVIYLAILMLRSALTLHLMNWPMRNIILDHVL